jgi:prepilin-type N-terminal cleavage/methylation domain-containing protein/prepilin-type processing-associated H-X9-DG protein
MKSTTYSPRAFTLIELIIVIAIIAALAALLLPAIGTVMDHARDAKCIENLRQVGIIINAAAIDNNSIYPKIENDSKHPMHPDPQEKVWTLPELVTAKGGSVEILKCPSDAAAKLYHASGAAGTTSYFDGRGSSYEWTPFFEGVNINAPTIVMPFGSFPIPLTRVRLLMDYAESGESSHDRGPASSVMHVFYADGHVQNVTLTKD